MSNTRLDRNAVPILGVHPSQLHWLDSLNHDNSNQFHETYSLDLNKVFCVVTFYIKYSSLKRFENKKKNNYTRYLITSDCCAELFFWQRINARFWHNVLGNKSNNLEYKNNKKNASFYITIDTKNQFIRKIIVLTFSSQNIPLCGELY